MEATCKVLESRSLTPTTHLVRIERPDDFSFAAGQHVLMEIDTETGPDERFLSIASGPHEDHLDFAVRLSKSDFKQAFARLDQGSPIDITGPTGRFKRDPDRPAILLSGGIGITPLRSMLLDAQHREMPPTRLVYGNRSPDDIPFQEELDELHDTRIQITHTVDQPTRHWKGRIGHIDTNLIDEARTGLESPVYYLCGPPGMVLALTKSLSSMGIKDLRVENFNGY